MRVTPSTVRDIVGGYRWDKSGTNTSWLASRDRSPCEAASLPGPRSSQVALKTLLVLAWVHSGKLKGGNAANAALRILFGRGLGTAYAGLVARAGYHCRRIAPPPPIPPSKALDMVFSQCTRLDVRSINLMGRAELIHHLIDHPEWENYDHWRAAKTFDCLPRKQAEWTGPLARLHELQPDHLAVMAWVLMSAPVGSPAAMQIRDAGHWSEEDQNYFRDRHVGTIFRCAPSETLARAHSEWHVPHGGYSPDNITRLAGHATNAPAAYLGYNPVCPPESPPMGDADHSPELDRALEEIGKAESAFKALSDAGLDPTLTIEVSWSITGIGN